MPAALPHQTARGQSMTCRCLARALRPIAHFAALTLAVFASSPAIAAAGPNAPATDDLPVVERFVSPVGDPEDFRLPAPGEGRGFCLTRGLQGRHRDRHLGLDLSNRQAGGEVRAPADGIVVEARRYRGWGQLVVIAHRLSEGTWVLSLLAHLQPGSVDVSAGDRVTAGQPIGAVGRSGHASGPHLHFELRRLGHANPWVTLWERAPVLDPLRVLGQRLADALFVGPTTRNGTDGGHCLQHAVSATGWRVGDPEARLTRREFYAWLARANGERLPRRASWPSVRARAAALGWIGSMPASAAAGLSPVCHEEASRALSLAMAGGRLRVPPAGERVDAQSLEVRGLTVPRLPEHEDFSWTTGPDRPLTRSDGALLLAAAREGGRSESLR